MANNEDWWDKVEGEPAPADSSKETIEPRLYAVSIEDLIRAQRLAIQPFLGSLLILCHAAVEAGLIDHDAQVAAVKGLSSDPEDILDAYLREAQKRRMNPDTLAGRRGWSVEMIDDDTLDDTDQADMPKPTQRPNFTLH